MEKMFKIGWLAGLGVALLFVSACENPAPPPRLTKPAKVVSKTITRSTPQAAQTDVPAQMDVPAQTDVPGRAVTNQDPVSDLKPDQDTDAGQGVTESGVDDAGQLQKAGIAVPMAEYDFKGRVDPFVPLIAEKNASAGAGSSVASKPKRPLTPLEKLELSQVTLVAVVEMKDRTIAMVEEAGGKGYEIGIGTYIGPNGGRVTAITPKGIEIEETVKDFEGKRRKRYEQIKFHKSENGEIR